MAGCEAMHARAYGLGREEEPGVRFCVCGTYVPQQTIDGRDWWPTFGEAVEAARSTIERFVYFEGTPRESVKFSRAFVALRATATGADHTSDHELLRWEVTPAQAIVNIVGHMDDFERGALEALAEPKGGWA